MFSTSSTTASRGRRTRPFATLAALAAVLVCGAICLAGCDFIDNLNPFTTTSVAEAEAARLAAREPRVQSPDIIEDGVLTVGLVTSEGAPSVFKTSTGYNGIDVDVAAALAAELGLGVKFVPLQDDATMALTPVDVVMGVPSTEAGGLMVASDYMEEAIGFFTLGDAPTTLSASELEGQTVGVQSASASSQLLATSNLTMTEQSYGNIDEAMEALVAGQVAYVLCPVYPGAFLANEIGGICFCGTLDVPVNVGVGVSAQNTALTDAVQGAMSDIRDNGVLALILSKWVGDLPRLTAASQVSGVELASPTQQTTTPNGDAGSNAVSGDDLPQQSAPEGTEGEGTEDVGTQGEGTQGEDGGEGAEGSEGAIMPI